MKILAGKEQDYQDWYNKNSDFYGRGCFNYAERWAELMEVEIEKSGKTPFETIVENAERLSEKADIDGITGFMYNAAVSILANCWEYGEDLRKWHNEKYDYNGDGVVNTSVIHIGTK